MRRHTCLILSILPLLTACEPLAISMLGAGAGTALRYSIDGVTTRTFTAPAKQVKDASLGALERMGITIDSHATFEGGELVFARAENRAIEIEIEPISSKATRMRIAAKNGGSFFYDTATASEIVAQTERLLESAARGASTPPAASVAPGAITPASTVTPALPKTSTN